MTKPNDFTLSTDYASYKNEDDSATLSRTVPASTNISSGSEYAISITATLGSQGSSTYSRISVSGEASSNPFVTQTLRVYRSDFRLPGSGVNVNHDFRAVVTRISATEVRLRVSIFNPYGETLRTPPVDKTFEAVVTTYLSPFV